MDQPQPATGPRLRAPLPYRRRLRPLGYDPHHASAPRSKDLTVKLNFPDGLSVPIPGRVVQLLVTVGDRVVRGQVVAILEAMKTELRITAPADGIVSKKSVQPGQIVAAGQPLLSLVPFEEIWVTANFKETQLNHMRVGQAAIIKVDAFGGREFRGRVESFAPATGARFSLLPPENASGNFVKVVQRIPVRIAFDNLAEARELLRPGMSVVATVVTGD